MPYDIKTSFIASQITSITGTTANFSSTTASTSNTTGSLTTSGGLGISNTTDATSSTNGGTITTAGGLAVAKKAYIGTDLFVTGNVGIGTTSTSNKLVVSGGGISQLQNTNAAASQMYIQNSNSGINAYSVLTVASDTANLNLIVNSSTRTSADSGASAATVRNDNGTLTLGWTGYNTIFPGNVVMNNTTASTSNTTGIITLAGGLGISNTTDATSSTNGGTITTAGGLAVAKKAFIGTDLSVGGTTNLANLTLSTALALDASKNIISVTNTGTGNNVLQANPTITGTLTTSAISATSGTFSTTLGVTGLITASGGLTSTAGTTTLGTSTIGAITGTSATFSSSLTVNSTTDSFFYNPSLTTTNSRSIILGRDASNFNTSTIKFNYNSANSNTNTIGFGFWGSDNLVTINGTGNVSATSATFSTTLGVTGLVTASGGLTSTAGTTTLGASTIGAITGTSASFSSTLGVTGLITANGGVSIPSSSNDQGSTFFLRNSNSGSLAYSQFSIGNDGVSTFNILLNSSTRTAEGGINTATIRNDAGILRLQSNSGIGVNINTSGNVDIGSTTASTSNNTGGLTLAGGLGISNTTDATSSTNGGSITTAGGLAVAKKAFIGTNTDTASINIRSTGGTYQAGSIYSDSGWGMLFRSAVNGPSLATFRFGRFDDTALMLMYDSGLVNIPGTTSSTSNSTGTLTLAGGLGISNTTDATSSTNGGTITTAGGLAVAKKAFIGTNLTAGSVTISGTNLVDKTISGNINWGFIFTADPALGGSYLFASANAGTNYVEINSSKTLRVYGNIGIDSTTASSSNTTGAITTAGGLGISNTTDATSSTNGGTITTAGGLAVAKKAYFGSDLIAGSIQTTNFNSISTQGGYLQWNRTGIEGETWLINTTIGTNPGIRFGKSTLANSVTELMRIRDNGNVNITTSISSTSNTTGSLTLTGGVGISNTTDATSSINGGSITTAGGLAVAKKAFIGTDLIVGGNTVRSAQIVGLTITSLQALPAVIDWDFTYTGTLANMSLSQSSGVFTYSGANPSTLYLNIGIYLTGFTDSIVVVRIYLNGTILSRHSQYCVNGSNAMANSVINVSNTDTFEVYVDAGSGNANNSGSSYTWLRISQI
jgi:hypothetical protein